MTVPDLPRWVWDLVIGLQKQEDEHAELFWKNYLDELVKSDWCPGVSLAVVPVEVQDAAKAIATYAGADQ